MRRLPWVGGDADGDAEGFGDEEEGEESAEH
jgi:hypothetical protein